MLQDPHEVRSIFDQREIAFADAASKKCSRERPGSRTQLKNRTVRRTYFFRDQTGKRVTRRRDGADPERIGDP